MKGAPLTIVIFGSTGDLYQKKLATALFDLYAGGQLGKDVRIVGYGRRPYSHEDFRSRTKEAIVGSGKKFSEQSLNAFLQNVFYVKGEIEDPTHYISLAAALELYDRERNMKSNKLFYLAVSPQFYEVILKGIVSSSLTKQDDGTFSRILVEKPFGNDLSHALKLDKLSSELFSDDQLFRIDHYLAKPALQEMLKDHFSKTSYRSKWDKKHIEKVVISFFEKHIVGDRGALYDGIGALHDVGQNHMLQMLALTVMEKPKISSATHIREEREAVFKKLVVPTVGKETIFSRAQYEGYTTEKGVTNNSETETYFKITLGIDNKRWGGVPFYLEGGKAFAEPKVSIEIFFKDKTILEFSIQPEKKIKGREKQMDAYEKIFIDAINADQTLFTTAEEVFEQWKIIGKVSEILKKTPLKTYPKGSVISLSL